MLDQFQGADHMVDTYSITELAREFDVTTRTIRFYEDQGLVEPQRRGRTRVYSQRDRTRLKLVLRGKRLGFSLSDISEIIGMYDAELGEAGQLRLFVKKIAARRALLEQQKEDIDVTLEELDTIDKQCRERLRSL